MSNSDQLEEIEVLSSIYPSEFELLPPADDSTLTNFKIHLVPSTTDGKHHGILLYLVIMRARIFAVSVINLDFSVS